MLQLETDVSDLAVGAILRILTANGYKPVAYESQLLSKSEHKFPFHNKDCLQFYALKMQCFSKKFKIPTILMDQKFLDLTKTQS